MLLSLLLTVAAWPCAGMVHEDGVLAESDAAEVLFRLDGGDVSVTYSVEYAGDAAAFGWVIPIPGAFTSLADGDQQTFDDLRILSQPTVEWFGDDDSDGGGGCGCGASSKSLDGGMGGDTADSNSLGIVAEGFTGTYDYVVLSAGTAAELTDWLSANGWELGSAAAAVEHYVGLGDQFVALSISPQTAMTPDEGRRLPPVEIRYAGTTMRFPAKMAATASAPSQRTTLYVTGEDRAQMTGWSAEEIGLLVGDYYDDFPEELYDETIGAMGAGTGYGITFANTIAGGDFLTRFDTLAPSASHTDDVTVAFGGGTSTVETRIELYETQPTGAWLLLPLLGLGLFRRRITS